MLFLQNDSLRLYLHCVLLHLNILTHFSLLRPCLLAHACTSVSVLKKDADLKIKERILLVLHVEY